MVTAWPKPANPDNNLLPWTILQIVERADELGCCCWAYVIDIEFDKKSRKIIPNKLKTGFSCFKFMEYGIYDITSYYYPVKEFD